MKPALLKISRFSLMSLYLFAIPARAQPVRLTAAQLDQLVARIALTSAASQKISPAAS